MSQPTHDALPNIVFVTGSQVLWGAEHSLLTIAQALNKNASLTLISSNSMLNSKWQEHVAPRVVRCRSRPGRLTRMASFVYPIMTRIPQKSTVVFFDFYLLPLAFILLPWFRLKRITTVVDIHDSAARNPRRKPYFRLATYLNCIVCVSRYIEMQFPEGSRTRVIDRPVQIDPHPLLRVLDGPQTRPWRLGIVGQVAPSKHIERAIELTRLLGENYRLIVRGGASEENQQYAQDVAKLGEEVLGSRFAMEGPVAQARSMDSLDALLMLNDDEPFGRVVVEAQMFGIIAIAIDGGGPAELIDDLQTGILLAQPIDENAARKIVSTLESHGQSIESIISRARTIATVRYSPESVASQYLTAILS